MIRVCFILAAMSLVSNASEITVFAAASLNDALVKIAAAYELQSADHVLFNFGASNLLERQIEQGAPADVFVSADEARMDQLERANLLLPGSRHDLLGNSLVIVIAKDEARLFQSAADLTQVERLALAQPDTVPAGIYARAFLEKAGLWTAFAPKVVPTENVRAAMAAVESGNADAAIVYKTDALISKKVKVAIAIPAVEGPKIRYPLALIKSAPQTEAAKRFADYLLSAPARTIFTQFGFSEPDAP